MKDNIGRRHEMLDRLKYNERTGSINITDYPGDSVVKPTHQQFYYSLWLLSLQRAIRVALSAMSDQKPNTKIERKTLNATRVCIVFRMFYITNEVHLDLGHIINEI